MKTIALRFADNYAPSSGTINLHNEVIKKNGYVWYGKFGNSLSQNNIDMLLKMEEKKFLLIKSGTVERYWVYFTDIKKHIDNDSCIPEYYRNNKDRVKCWFKVIKFELADQKIMSNFVVSSSKAPLSDASKHSLNPYFVIETKEE